MATDFSFTARGPEQAEGRLSEMLQVWSLTLRARSLGVDNDFFAVGGSSLTEALIVAAANRRFKSKLTLR